MIYEDSVALWVEIWKNGLNEYCQERLLPVTFQPLPIIEKHLSKAFELGKADGLREAEHAAKIAYGRGFVDGKDEAHAEGCSEIDTDKAYKEGFDEGGMRALEEMQKP
jgi:hypothetical protein